MRSVSTGVGKGTERTGNLLSRNETDFGLGGKQVV